MLESMIDEALLPLWRVVVIEVGWRDYQGYQGYPLIENKQVTRVCSPLNLGGQGERKGWGFDSVPYSSQLAKAGDPWKRWQDGHEREEVGAAGNSASASVKISLGWAAGDILRCTSAGLHQL